MTSLKHFTCVVVLTNEVAPKLNVSVTSICGMDLPFDKATLALMSLDLLALLFIAVSGKILVASTPDVLWPN